MTTETRSLRALEQIRYDIGRMGTIVSTQLEDALTAFSTFDLALANEAIDKDDLVDNLNLRVEEEAYKIVSRSKWGDSDCLAARTAIKVAINLERIGDAATHIAKRLRIMVREEIKPIPYDLQPAKKVALQSVEDGVWAYLQEDLDVAKRACELEPEIDQLYVEGIEFVRAAVLKDPESIDYFLNLLSVLKYVEKVGDYVLNIGEQAIYAITGKHLKFTQFQQLDSLLDHSDEEAGFKTYLDGISGAVVALVGSQDPVVFKEGSQRKIEEEVVLSLAWHNIDETITPRVLTTVSFADRQAFLREYVDGDQLSHIYFVEGDPELQRIATEQLLKTIKRVWMLTMKLEPTATNFVKQIEDRLEEVYSFHPHIRHLATSEFSYRRMKVLPLDEQLDRAREIEAAIMPPVSVWLHGDFNPNNIMYNKGDKSIKFIDIHRSRFGDYLQDVSVFLVGLQRDPNLSPSIRKQMKHVESMFIDFVGEFAAEFEDTNWQNRMLLGMGRSYLTSSRIILQPAHAEWLFREGRITLQKLIQSAKS